MTNLHNEHGGEDRHLGGSVYDPRANNNYASGAETAIVKSTGRAKDSVTGIKRIPFRSRGLRKKHKDGRLKLYFLCRRVRAFYTDIGISN